MVRSPAVRSADGAFTAAVSAITDAFGDPTRRRIYLYTRADIAPETLWERLNQTELPKLWIPRRDSLHHVTEIPTLGTGKVDLRRLKQLAVERAGVTVN